MEQQFREKETFCDLLLFNWNCELLSRFRTLIHEACFLLSFLGGKRMTRTRNRRFEGILRLEVWPTNSSKDLQSETGWEQINYSIPHQT